MSAVRRCTWPIRRLGSIGRSARCIGSIGPWGPLMSCAETTTSGASFLPGSLALLADAPESIRMKDTEQIARMQLVYGGRDEQLDALLSESLSPRAPDFLLDLATPLLTTASRLLD